MRFARKDGRLALTCNLPHSRFLRRILNSIADNYQIKPAQMDPKSAVAWYSRRGCETAKLSEDDTREWLDALHGFRSARLGLLQEWIAQLAAPKAGEYELLVKPEEAHHLVGVFNDHRLLLAARNDIGQAEMDVHLLSATGQLSPARQAALFEIHLLAQIIEELLRWISPEAAQWMG